MECKANHSTKKRAESAIKILNNDLTIVTIVPQPIWFQNSPA